MTEVRVGEEGLRSSTAIQREPLCFLGESVPQCRDQCLWNPICLSSALGRIKRVSEADRENFALKYGGEAPDCFLYLFVKDGRES